MSKNDKGKVHLHISGAGVVSVNSSEIFSSENGKRQIQALKRIHEQRKKRHKPK